MDYEIENSLIKAGYKLIGGIDEAGRGPLAGPVAAACVILDPSNIPKGINDSKKLSAKKRGQLFDEIYASAIAVSCVTVDEKVIDEINILNATKLAMRNAVADIAIKPDFLIIDGNFTIGLSESERCVIGGDALSLSIAAASIIAKVTRDRIAMKMDEEFPMYGFKDHKGYGTKAHTEALRKYGPCKYHRTSFLKKILSDGNKYEQ